MHTQVVLFDGFDPLDAIAPYEVLYAGGSATDGAVTVELVTAEGPREVVSGIQGLTLRAVGALDLERADMLLVPGASGRVGEPGVAPEEEVGVGERKQDEFIPVLLGRTLTTELPALLKQAMDDPGITVTTVCGGSLVLAMAGLLEGRHATTHHMGLDMLDATGAHAVRARIVDDGDLITGAGVTSGLDLGLYLLEREVGPASRTPSKYSSPTSGAAPSGARWARRPPLSERPALRRQSLTIPLHKQEEHQHARRRPRPRRPDHRPREHASRNAAPSPMPD